ncbi:hypothetical protein [Comamonas testosteroni]|uniref:hypothetical protein n=1 Tax=Comamonas testosteroni TaxID=285 RepID=UPI0011109EFF|nr:hypothetical protein [Comamonas testosteroni]QQN70472.1 hypothetical protein IYN88_03330 [Comamonas testosteroni]
MLSVIDPEADWFEVPVSDRFCQWFVWAACFDHEQTCNRKPRWELRKQECNKGLPAKAVALPEPVLRKSCPEQKKPANQSASGLSPSSNSAALLGSLR